MKNIRLIATDLDGTFFTDNKDLSVKNMKAASDAFERGILIAVSYTHLFGVSQENIVAIK